jgi:hypothetical protein
VEEIEDKFLTLSGPVIGEDRAKAALRAVCEIGLKSGVREIVPLLCP